MDKYRAFRGIHPHSRKIFIVGCGRSGTNWLGYILASHPSVHVTIEKKSIFNKVTAMAVDPGKKHQLLKPLLLQYRWEHALVAPLHYADKSHPNLWLAEDLAAAFPNALFVGIQRGPYGTAASMLNHKGVRAWCERWKELSIPNPFLGITNSNVEMYSKLSLPARCAMRWVSHSKQMKKMQKKLDNRMHVVQYVSLIQKTDQEIEKLQRFLNLSTPILIPQVKSESLEKWRGILTGQDRADIEKIIGEKDR